MKTPESMTDYLKLTDAQKMELAGLPPVRSEPMFSISRFRSVLVKHGIIFAEAIEDAEGFDGERTLAATRAAYDELMENEQFRRDSAAPERKP